MGASQKPSRWALLACGGLVLATGAIWLTASVLRSGSREGPAIDTIDRLGGTIYRDASLRIAGEPILRYGPIVEVQLTSTMVSDTDLQSLQSLPRLRSLWLQGTRVTDSGLRSVANCRGLVDLLMDGTGVTDTGIAALNGLSNLRTLSLNRTAVVGTGFSSLRSLKELRFLYLNRSPHTGKRIGGSATA